MILFLFPFVILTSTFTIQWLYELSKDRIQWAAVAFTILLSFLMLYGSLYNTTVLMLNPLAVREFNGKQAVATLKTTVSDEEAVYIYHAATPVFRFYWREKPDNSAALFFGILSRDDESKYKADLDQLQAYPTAWVVFSHVYPTYSLIDEREYMLDYLDSIGKRVQEFHPSEGTHVYQYQFEPIDAN